MSEFDAIAATITRRLGTAAGRALVEDIVKNHHSTIIYVPKTTRDQRKQRNSQRAASLSRHGIRYAQRINR